MTGDEDLPLVLLDTNALFMPFQLGLDLEGEIQRVMGRCRVAVPRVALAELGSMADSVRDGRAALQLARRFEVVETTGLGDDAVVDAALVTGAVVVTGDRGLIRRCQRAGVRVLRPRGRKQLVMK